MTLSVVIVTDPMCSWCWGMTPAIVQAREILDARAPFELMLGGINVDGTQPIGDFGRKHIYKIWQEVTATTGQKFGDRLPDNYVHNSVTACLAVEAVRELSGAEPFDFLHELQSHFFLRAGDLTDRRVLLDLSEAHGFDRGDVHELMVQPRLLDRVQRQFRDAKSFGTHALPSVLIRQDGVTRLLAGGYLNAEMLVELVEERMTH